MKFPIQKYFLFFLAFFVINACNQENSFDCIKSAGKIESREIFIEDFTSITLTDNVDVFLQTGQEQKIVITAGKNLINKLYIEVQEKDLIISNKNTCNWVRKYESIKIYITAKDLENINYLGYGNIKSSEKLFLPSLKINAELGNGLIELDLESDHIHVFSRSYANITLTGKVKDLNLEFYYNHGRFLGQELEADNVYINHFGLNTIAVHPISLLNTHIGHSGNVEYFHEPENIEAEISSTGKLVNKAK